MQNCGHCRYYQVYINPETKRPKPSEAGICLYPLPTKLPFFALMAVNNRARVWPGSGARCQTFEAKAGEVTGEQLALVGE